MERRTKRERSGGKGKRRGKGVEGVEIRVFA